jgi:Xaa-Pro aminopeptidase
MIFGRHSVLKRGCSTWNKQEMPEEEFQARLDLVRRDMMRSGLDALVIYGDNYSFADLCYLTNYFPKVRGGIAMIPRTGPITLLLNIGSRDVPFAKTLTCVEDVRASGQVGRDGAKLIQEKGLSRAKIGLVDSGRGFPLPQLEEMESALPQVQWSRSDSIVRQFRVRKSGRELAAMRSAGGVLKEVWEEASSIVQDGRKEYEVMADMDRLARAKGVEDIRILAGEKRLQPPSFNMTAPVRDHWAVYLAIQHERYWVEAGHTFNLKGDAKIETSYRKAREIVAAMAACLDPGSSIGKLDAVAREQLGEFYATAALYGLGNGVGLDQWEPPFLSADEARQMGIATAGSASLQLDMTVALHVVFQSQGKLILFGDTYQVTPGGPRCLVEK